MAARGRPRFAGDRGHTCMAKRFSVLGSLRAQVVPIETKYYKSWG